MKKIISLLMILTLCLGFVGCGDGCGGGDHGHSHDHSTDPTTYTTYFNGGLYYSLPGEFVAKNYSYGDYVYANGERAYVIINVYDEVELEEDMYIPKDISVREFAQMIVSDRMCDPYKYDEATDTATLDYVYKYDEDVGMPNEYYLYKILRNQDSVYQVVLSCDEADIAKYKETFSNIIKLVTLG